MPSLLVLYPARKISWGSGDPAAVVLDPQAGFLFVVLDLDADLPLLVRDGLPGVPHEVDDDPAQLVLVEHHQGLAVDHQLEAMPLHGLVVADVAVGGPGQLGEAAAPELALLGGALDLRPQLGQQLADGVDAVHELLGAPGDVVVLRGLLQGLEEHPQRAHLVVRLVEDVTHVGVGAQAVGLLDELRTRDLLAVFFGAASARCCSSRSSACAARCRGWTPPPA